MQTVAKSVNRHQARLVERFNEVYRVGTCIETDYSFHNMRRGVTSSYAEYTKDAARVLVVFDLADERLIPIDRLKVVRK